jgi:hypothetical protein
MAGISEAQTVKPTGPNTLPNFGFDRVEHKRIGHPLIFHSVGCSKLMTVFREMDISLQSILKRHRE